MKPASQLDTTSPQYILKQKAIENRLPLVGSSEETNSAAFVGAANPTSHKRMASTGYNFPNSLDRKLTQSSNLLDNSTK